MQEAIAYASFSPSDLADLPLDIATKNSSDARPDKPDDIISVLIAVRKDAGVVLAEIGSAQSPAIAQLGLRRNLEIANRSSIDAVSIGELVEFRHNGSINHPGNFERYIAQIKGNWLFKR